MIVLIYVFYFLSSSLFDHNRLVQVSVLSCEYTDMTTQHYSAFQCFIVSSAMETHDNTADLVVSFLCVL